MESEGLLYILFINKQDITIIDLLSLNKPNLCKNCANPACCVNTAVELTHAGLTGEFTTIMTIWTQVM